MCIVYYGVHKRFFYQPDNVVSSKVRCGTDDGTNVSKRKISLNADSVYGRLNQIIQ
jgi:hypothetical protein